MKKNIAIIGLGYVGLPLAVEFSKKYKVIGYDIDKLRAKEINDKYDRTNEIDFSELENVLEKNNKFPLTVTSNPEKLINSNVYIITVPTPVDSENKPDLKAIESATLMVSNFLKKVIL